MILEFSSAITVVWGGFGHARCSSIRDGMYWSGRKCGVLGGAVAWRYYKKVWVSKVRREKAL